LFKISLFWGCLLVCLLVLVPAEAQQSPADQAQALLKESKAERALPILLQLHRDEPSNPNLCQQIGVIYTQLNDLAHAEEFYREAVRLDPQFYAARKNHGIVLWFLNRKVESEHEFLVVTRARPADPVPHLYLGLAAAQRREFVQAKQEFVRAGTLASENPEVVQPVLESFLATHDLTFPTALLAKLNHAEDPDREMLSRVGALFLQYGYYDQAITALETVISARKESAETMRLLAKARDLQHKPELAYAAYSRAIEMDPNSEDGYLELAEFSSAHANDSYALQVVTRGLERVPQSPRLWFEQGILLDLIGDRSKAQASFSEAGKLKPDWNLPLLALGVSTLESGNAVEAASFFNKARTVDPNDARGWYLYALALSRGSADTDATRLSAIASLRKATELDPKNAASHALLGRFELGAGNSESASREWANALKLDPDNATALYQLSLLYRREGKTTRADELLKRFEQLKAEQATEEKQLVEILKVAPRNASR
jgi:Flp pilus assembly protein TadD